MAVMLIANVLGSDSQQQRSVVEHLEQDLRTRPGFHFHAGGPTDDGWRLYEVWETREQLDAWLNEQVFPNLPPGMEAPDIEIVPIEITVVPER